MQVQEVNSRLQRELGGGTLYDIGIYCINAARNLFRSEPLEVTAFTGRNGERRFEEVEEMTSGLLRFPEDKLASFVCSFGAAEVSEYQIVGTKGTLTVDPAYEHAGKLKHIVNLNGRKNEKTFGQRDQFGPELLYFSKCIQRNEEPEPSGLEGLADVRIIRALYESVRTGSVIRLPAGMEKQWPDIDQEIKRPAVDKPDLVNAESPSGK